MRLPASYFPNCCPRTFARSDCTRPDLNPDKRFRKQLPTFTITILRDLGTNGRRHSPQLPASWDFIYFHYRHSCFTVSSSENQQVFCGRKR
jgi:hypothetical protein